MKAARLRHHSQVSKSFAPIVQAKKPRVAGPLNLLRQLQAPLLQGEGREQVLVPVPVPVQGRGVLGPQG